MLCWTARNRLKAVIYEKQAYSTAGLQVPISHQCIPLYTCEEH